MDHNNVSNESNLQEKIMKQIHDLGDTLERAGQKIERSGWETIGQAIYKLGDALEHLNEKSFKGTSKDKDMNASSVSTPSSNLNASNSFSASNPSVGQHPAGASVTTDFSTSSPSTDTFANNDSFTGTQKKNESDYNTSDRI
jgi:hypothetical protein